MSRSLLSSTLREPLMQFLAIGVLLFTADRLVILQRDNPYEIIIDSKEVARLVEVFTEGQGRPPSEEEVDKLLVTWSQNEIFYREARAMGLDRGDDMMRSRLILKMRNVIFNRVIEHPPEERELRNWFELNRQNYDVPERYTIERLPLPAVEDVADARLLSTQFNEQGLPKEQSTAVRQYPRRSRDNLETLFTAANTAALLDAPPGQWVPIQASGSWSLLRVSASHAGIPATFETAKAQAAKDFGKAASGLQVSEMADEVAKKYRVHLELEDQDLQTILADAANYEQAEITAQSRSLKARAGVAGSVDPD